MIYAKVIPFPRLIIQQGINSMSPVQEEGGIYTSFQVSIKEKMKV